MAENGPTVAGLLEEMTASFSSTRELIASLNQNQPELDCKNGISLLSLKHQVLISYIRSMVLLSSRRALALALDSNDSLSSRTPPSASFGTKSREQRGDAMGDLVDNMIEGRVVLEKIRPLEARMRYQIEKLVRIGKEDATTQVTDDPLAFRPNPLNLLSKDGEDEADSGQEPEAPTSRRKVKERYIPSDDDAEDDGDGIYRPPRLAPTPYIPPTKGNAKSRRSAPLPTTLSSLLHSADPSQPHMETTTGLGGAPDGSRSSSSRARYLAHLTEFEEAQFGRVMLGKKEEKRRRRDEGVLAIGGGLSGIAEDGANGKRGRTAGGLEDEFMDVLRDSDRRTKKGMGDGYEELRTRSKKSSAFERSRKRPRMSSSADDGEPSSKFRTRFEAARKSVKVKKRK